MTREEGEGRGRGVEWEETPRKLSSTLAGVDVTDTMSGVRNVDTHPYYTTLVNAYKVVVLTRDTNV